MHSANDQKVFDEQISYYRARAAEYDEWYLRTGRYDRGPEFNALFVSELKAMQQELHQFKPRGKVLEFASGTGWWTEILLQYADQITALDSSAEVLALNRQRNGAAKVEYVQTDLFQWHPAGKYDVIFFGCWLSHVPLARFTEFWDLVRASLSPRGRVFFIDTLGKGISRLAAWNHHQEETEEGTTLRYLNDGRSYRIVKIFYQPAELQSRLAALGWKIEVESTANFFFFGRGGYDR